MMASWPSSTPRLKQTSAVGTCCSGTPSSSSADAKPSPCKRPNAKATAQGARRVSESAGRRHSPQTSTMDSAIDASTGGEGTCTTPSTVSARLTLWASVKAVMVARSCRPRRTSSVSATTKSR